MKNKEVVERKFFLYYLTWAEGSLVSLLYR